MITFGQVPCSLLLIVLWLIQDIVDGPLVTGSSPDDIQRSPKTIWTARFCLSSLKPLESIFQAVKHSGTEPCLINYHHTPVLMSVREQLLLNLNHASSLQAQCLIQAYITHLLLVFIALAWSF